MDKIEKFLRKLGKKEREAFELIFLQMYKDYRRIPGLRRLVGKKSCFRIRLGRYRIIFLVQKGKIEITKITKRDDQIYKSL